MAYKSFFCLVLICVCISINTYGSDDRAHSSAVDASVLLADPDSVITNELAMLDTLIVATQQSLEQQKVLRDLITKYLDTQEAFLEDSENKELLYRTVKLAHRVSESIKENHLIHNFDAAFLSELNLLSQVAVKYGEPKP